jgi:hypothetical protein
MKLVFWNSASQIHDIKLTAANKSVENVAKFKYLKSKATLQNYIHDEVLSNRLIFDVGIVT